MLNTEENTLKQMWEDWYPRVYSYFYKRVSNRAEVEGLTANTMKNVFMQKDFDNFTVLLWKVAHYNMISYIDSNAALPIIIEWDSQVDLNWQPDIVEYNLTEIQDERYNKRMAVLMACMNNNLQEEKDRQLVDLTIIEEKSLSEIISILKLDAIKIQEKLNRILIKTHSNCLHLWSQEKC